MKITEHLFDSLLEPVVILAENKKVIYCNEAFALLVGNSKRKISRGSIDEVITFAPPIDVFENLSQITDASPYREVNFVTAAQTEGKVQVTIQPFEAKNWIVFIRDVTLEETLQKKYRAELNQKESVIVDLEKAKIELQKYSKNLETMVDERTRQLSQANKTMAAMMDSLGQGFFIFNKSGDVLDVSSKACAHVIEGLPNRKKIWDVLKIEPAKVEGFQKWMTTVFAEMLPFEDLVPLAPHRYKHSAGLTISLEYHPMRDQDAIENIVVVATDISSLVAAQKQAEQEKEHAKLIIHMIKSKREIHRFIQESRLILKELKKQVHANRLENPNEIFRCLHTLKGGAALFNIKKLSDECHEAEQILSELRTVYSQAGFVALRGKCFDIEEQFELFLEETKEILGSGVTAAERHIEIELKRLNSIANKIEKIPGGGPLAKDLLLELAMEPVSRFIEPYNDLVDRTAIALGKSLAPLHIHNGTTLVVPEVYSPLFSTLVHAFRNAVDHGIETPDQRIEAGKSPEGQIEISFKISQKNQQRSLRICIKDDGRGIDPQAIRRKLDQCSIRHDHLSDFEAIQNVFESQFSTREIVSGISGRGVGMDAVREAALDLGGRCWVESSLGQGTSVFIEVPYTTEIPAIYEKVA